jgi:hypothetical protein
MATPTTLPSTFTAGQVLTAAQMNNLRGAFRVLQVVSTTKSDTFTTTSTTFTDITGLSLTITPSATTSKILVFSNVVGVGNAIAVYFQLMRDSTAIGVGDVRGSRSRISGLVIDQTGGSGAFHTPPMVLDSPSSTSALTYKIQVRAQSAGTLYINRSITDTDSSGYWTGASTITAMEISA